MNNLTRATGQQMRQLRFNCLTDRISTRDVVASQPLTSMTGLVTFLIWVSLSVFLVVSSCAWRSSSWVWRSWLVFWRSIRPQARISCWRLQIILLVLPPGLAYRPARSQKIVVTARYAVRVFPVVTPAQLNTSSIVFVWTALEMSPLEKISSLHWPRLHPAGSCPP